MTGQWWREPEPGCGRSPAVVLWNPKYAFNVGQSLRNSACWDAPQMWVTGTRWENGIGSRLPREERMRVFSQEVAVYRCMDPFRWMPPDCTPIAVEIRESAEIVDRDWAHPDKAWYVFGPEDGSLPGYPRSQCHQHIVLPTRHCLNLANAAGAVLAHRMWYRMAVGLEPRRAAKDLLFEERGR